MQKQRVLIAGCGDVGTHTGLLLAAQGHQVFGLRRTINQLPQGIQGIEADLTRPETLTQLPEVDYLIYCASAGKTGTAGYRAIYQQGIANLLAALRCLPRHIFYTSSTRVYAQHQHEWVDEHSVCQPESEAGQILLAGEALINALPNASIVRFSGIYGPERNHLLNQVKAGRVAPPAPVLYTNRIHRDDCAGVLAFLLAQQVKGTTLAPLYLASDSHPATLHEVTHWLAKQLDISATTGSFQRSAGSKRCNNRQLLEAGYRFSYPGYQHGYSAELKNR